MVFRDIVYYLVISYSYIFSLVVSCDSLRENQLRGVTNEFSRENSEQTRALNSYIESVDSRTTDHFS